VLGLDVGSYFVGLALSDASNMTAQPLASLKRAVKIDANNQPVHRKITKLELETKSFRRQSVPFSSIAGVLAAYMQQYNVAALCVGFPYTVDGRTDHAQSDIKQFVQQLQTSPQLQRTPVFVWDESFSSQAASDRLRASAGPAHPNTGGMGRTWTARKQQSDMHAAAGILQEFLDYMRSLPATP